MSEPELYKSVQVVEAGLPGTDGVARRSYSLGQDGVTAIRVLPDLRVRIVRKDRDDFDFWPQNVVLGAPLRMSCPTQSPAPEADSPCPSAAASPVQPNSGVAQPAEHNAVNVGDVGSNPTPGATSEARLSSDVADDAGEAQLDEPALCTQEVAGSSPAPGSNFKHARRKGRAR